ncbi:hypothetical protein [Parasphingorhabdus cellanae]|uniref:Uncharacterized protein n=1 Tax=Parasphingorhabdus cellanae TaxID=2806553 RepID=A0ABX7T350_9SPHN|nr:hypothetical protein [Parasphingorhabdus cellanae]QTD55989.1 hypothetical protein J4G78_17725 [Parasphingorhabdus cellanae]
MTDISPAPDAPIADEDDPLAFIPVPFAVKHYRGWTPDRQRQFIHQLSRIGVVSAAAKAVGMTRDSAYKLRKRKGAESFAAAWDMALEMGCDNGHDHAITRAIEGYTVPYFYGGLMRGEVRRYDNRLLFALMASHSKRND